MATEDHAIAPTSSRPLVSIVTPFHNTARHLSECIDSVIAQSYEHFEFILQDNASNDGSTEIALEFADRDPRIRYFRLDSLLPQVENYNLALRRLTHGSAYCKIVQADDWIAGDCVRQMVEIAERSPRIGLVSSFALFGETVQGEGLPYTSTVVPGHEVARLHLLEPYFLFGSPTTVLYRSAIVRSRDPFFTLGRLNEDTEACYEILKDWDFGFAHQILSYSRMDEASIYGQTRDKDAGILDRLIMLRRYGRNFLNASEYAQRLDEVERRYYRQLARAALAFRDAPYWQFHRHGLSTEGPDLEATKLMRQLSRELLSLLACPQQAVALLRSWLEAARGR